LVEWPHDGREDEYFIDEIRETGRDKGSEVLRRIAEPILRDA
jgi:hypothetical protein